MTEMNNSEAIVADEHSPSAAELDFAISELTDIKHSIMSLSDNAGAGYRFASRMAGKSFINMREQDLGFMRGYWLGIDAALREVRDLLHDREYMRSELYGDKQEDDIAGD
jgi:hypothetical protein